MLSNIYDAVVKGNQKAIVAFVLSAVAVFVAQAGFTVDTTIGEVVEALVAGVISAVGVWFKANK